ncbi:hypothetical protein GCM10009663_23700 [Kitasatospora arboriphila]|uniref:MmyB-like transcription regulator ligand binding domain-containing protein n=1 Tax=Kitasatospora arboriphila TaxID=258052 RepID=A0ABN1TFD1_9ACTN
MLWARHEVHGKSAGAKLHHPRAGGLELAYETLTPNSAPGRQLVVYRAVPGSPSAERLSLLQLQDTSARPVGPVSGTGR